MPVSIDYLADGLCGAPFFWCLAGGEAVERYVGHSFRSHDDLDIVVLRSEFDAVQDWLGDWRFHAADPPGALRLLARGEPLPASVHDIWCHREGRESWELQIMIQESDGESWHYRRDDRVRGALSELAGQVAGVPCLRMDLQLLYKSKTIRPKDEMDFRALLPLLTLVERDNLIGWLQLVYPGGHPWTAHLATREVNATASDQAIGGGTQGTPGEHSGNTA